MFSLGLITAGCLNPFAPIEGDVGETVWSDQRTVRGLLDNFALSYDYRDSLRYSDCLDESFVFRYYNAERGYYDSWFRETDLITTGGMFRAFDLLSNHHNISR